MREMSRPIEKYGWGKIQPLEDYDESFENKISKEKVSFRKDGFISLNIDKDNEITFKELQAIYGTAKQIKEEDNPSDSLEKDLLFEKETDDNVNIELQRKKVEKEIKRCSEEVKKYEEKFEGNNDQR